MLREALNSLTYSPLPSPFAESQVASSSGFEGARWLRARLAWPLVTVLAYHRIGRPEDAQGLDPELFETTTDDFAEQMAYLASNAEVLPLRDAFTHGRKRTEKPAVVVTFDDGYLDNYERALPILRRYAIPATLFIPTAFPDAGRLFWWDRIALSIARTKARMLDLRYPVKRLVRVGDHDRGRVRRALTRIVKDTQSLDFARFWDDIERATGVSLSPGEERAIANRTIMGFEHIRTAHALGFDIGSHAHTHRVLDTVSPERAVADLALSRQILESTLGEPPEAVAYPVGRRLPKSHSKIAERAGFKLGFTNATGIATPWSNRLQLPRVSMSPEQTRDQFAFRVVCGESAGVAKIASLLPGMRPKSARLIDTHRPHLGSAKRAMSGT